MTVDQLLHAIKTSPDTLDFNEVIATINQHYSYTPTLFTNGIGEHKIVNEAGKNEGSCRLFAFAKLHHLSKEQTLACFGKIYRDEVLKNPLGSDHQNIRKFMEYGWMGIAFDGVALKEKWLNKPVRPLLIILILLALAALLWWQKPRVSTAITSVTSKVIIPKPPAAETKPTQQEQQEPEQQGSLNLSLPKHNFLMDYDIHLPERTHNLRDLFRMDEKEPDIKVGGHLILEEKQPDPKAPLWDQVKGAEVGVTIKTP